MEIAKKAKIGKSFGGCRNKFILAQRQTRRSRTRRTVAHLLTMHCFLVHNLPLKTKTIEFLSLFFFCKTSKWFRYLRTVFAAGNSENSFQFEQTTFRIYAWKIVTIITRMLSRTLRPTFLGLKIRRVVANCRVNMPFRVKTLDVSFEQAITSLPFG